MVYFQFVIVHYGFCFIIFMKPADYLHLGFFVSHLIRPVLGSPHPALLRQLIGSAGNTMFYVFKVPLFTWDWTKVVLSFSLLFWQTHNQFSLHNNAVVSLTSNTQPKSIPAFIGLLRRKPILKISHCFMCLFFYPYECLAWI